MNVKPEKNNKSDKKEKYISSFKVDPDDKYPWLDKDDTHRNMTDREIIEKFVDLSKSEFTEKENARSFFYYGSQLGGGSFFVLFLSALNFWGMFVRVYPKIVQGLTFLNSVKHITIILVRCTS